MKKIFVYFLIIAFLSGTTGCNIFSWLHQTEDSAEGYIADGKGHLNSEDFESALTSFALAKNEDSNNSDAMYWHAVAAARYYQITIADLGIELFLTISAGDITQGDDLFEGFDPSAFESMFTGSTIITDDLQPIFLEDPNLTGTITKDDIAITYVLNLTLSGLLFIAKIGATLEEFGFTIDEDGNIVFNNGLNGIDNVNDLVDTTFELLDDAVAGYSAITGDVEGAQEFQETTEAIRDSINKYKIEIGVDNDGDGLIDEEFLNGIDDDGDGLVDEDSTGTFD